MLVTVSVDDKDGPYQGFWIDPVVFSDDGKHWATRVVRKQGYYILVDGRKKEVDPSCGPVHFSPNEKHLAYTIANKKRTKEYLVIDETEFKEYTEIGGDEFQFGSDGSLTFSPPPHVF